MKGARPAAAGADDALGAAYFDAAQHMTAQLSHLNAAKPEPLPVL